MFGRRIDPKERQKALELLTRWIACVEKIDRATDAAKRTIAEQPLGMASEEFEIARLAALEVAEQVRKETTDPRFWPVLEDHREAMIMFEFRTKLQESYGHQLDVLRLWGMAADACRRGRDWEAPSEEELMSANKSFARVLEQIGKAGGKLARHYRMSVQDYQREALSQVNG